MVTVRSRSFQPSDEMASRAVRQPSSQRSNRLSRLSAGSRSSLVAVLVFQVHRSPPEPAHRETSHTWGTMLLLALFYGLTVWLDMFIGIAVVMFLMCLLWGERRLLVAAASALITPLAIFFLFDKVLQVRFPRGLLTNWYYG